VEPFYTSIDYPFLTVTLSDIIFTFLIVLLMILGAFIYQKNKITKDSRYRFFTVGFIVKIFSVLAFCTIYLTVYGGDTLSYFHNMQVLNHLLLKNPNEYFDIIINGIDGTSLYYFTHDTGMPSYMWKDSSSFFVSRLLSPLALISGNSFLVSSVLVAGISYYGSWKLFFFLSEKHPALTKEMAISALFIPSVLFWGSGIMKDTIIVFCMSFALITADRMVQLKINAKNMLIFIFCAWLILIIKPYIVVALLPTIFIWMGYNQFKKIKHKMIKYVITPFVIAGVFGGILFTYSRLAQDLGKYSDFDSMINRAKVVQEDLLRAEQYGENNFYIGEITGTVANMLELFPQALMAGLFRPYIWEAGNIFMLISGVENLIILLLVIAVFFKRKIGKVFHLIGDDPFLLGLMVFVIFLAFGIGLSTSNFGALVRYRIPLMPLLIASMFILRYYYKQHMKQFSKRADVFFSPLGKK
jgi:hypothetical protein